MDKRQIPPSVYAAVLRTRLLDFIASLPDDAILSLFRLTQPPEQLAKEVRPLPPLPAFLRIVHDKEAPRSRVFDPPQSA